MHKRHLGLTFSLFALAAATGGCDNPAAKTELARHERSLNQLKHIMAGLEATRGQKLEQTWQMARKQNERDVLNSDRNAAKIERIWFEEYSRWEQKTPAYNKAIKRHLQGNPANIEPTLIKMAY